jgi:hyperosmotically inducible periplasmic protein
VTVKAVALKSPFDQEVMMKTKRLNSCSALLALAFGTAAATGASPAAAQTEPQRQPSRLFMQLDVNHDGYVSRSEAAKVRDFDKPFKEADENHDGKLSADEFIKAESIHQRLQAAEFVEDGVIAAKVKAALIKDSAFKALDVSVAAYRGRVLISGFVDDPRQARRAAELASSVRGVESVENAIKTK